MKRISAKKVIVALVFIAIATAGAFKFGIWLRYRLTHAVTENAFVEADIINVSPLVSGRIEKILVKESQKVKKGQELFRLEDSSFKTAVELKQAEVESIAKEIERLKLKVKQAQDALLITKKISEAKIQAAKADLKQTLIRLKQAKKDYIRFKKLYEKGAISRRKFDIIQEKYRRLKQLLNIKKAQLKEAEATKIEVEIKKAQLEEAKKALKVAQERMKAAVKALNLAVIKLGYTKVKSPIDGVIAKIFLHEGDFVAAGYPTIALYDEKSIYVIANLEETRFKGVKIGQEVDIKVDAYPDKVFKGRVKNILKASAAKFALIPRDVTAGEFTKVVQRIPIKIEITDKDKYLLIPGMSVEIGIKLK